MSHIYIYYLYYIAKLLYNIYPVTCECVAALHAVLCVWGCVAHSVVCGCIKRRFVSVEQCYRVALSCVCLFCCCVSCGYCYLHDRKCRCVRARMCVCVYVWFFIEVSLVYVERSVTVCQCGHTFYVMCMRERRMFTTAQIISPPSTSPPSPLPSFPKCDLLGINRTARSSAFFSLHLSLIIRNLSRLSDKIMTFFVFSLFSDIDIYNAKYLLVFYIYLSLYYQV